MSESYRKERQNAVKNGQPGRRLRVCEFSSPLSPIRPLRVVEVPAAAKRSKELSDRKPSIPGSLKKTDFGGVKQLLRLQHLVVAGKATEIAASCNGNRFGILQSFHRVAQVEMTGETLFPESGRYSRQSLT
jgi:hypothetical protein